MTIILNEINYILLPGKRNAIKETIKETIKTHQNKNISR